MIREEAKKIRMIEEQVLSREQMAHLKELGVDTSDASMCWLVFPEDKEDMVSVFYPDIMLGYATCKIYPTYTVSNLIKKLPKNIEHFQLRIDWYDECIEYSYWSCGEIIGYMNYFYFHNKPIIEVLYDCLCWVAEKHKELIN